MKITINYENREARNLIETVKATVDMYEGFGMDTNTIHNELNHIQDQIINGTLNVCFDSAYAGIKVDAAAKTVEFEIDPEIFCNNMKMSTVIIRKFKPVVTMIKSIFEVCEGIVSSVKEMVKKDMAYHNARHCDKSYLVTKKTVAGFDVMMIARKTRWDTYEIIQAEIINSEDVSETIQSVVLDEAMNNVDPADWKKCAEIGYMSLQAATEHYEFQIGAARANNKEC